MKQQTLLLTREDVKGLLTIEDCMAGVEGAFALHGSGRATAPKMLGLHVKNGGFHIKAGVLGLDRNYFVAKINANFSFNTSQYGLPTIQGIIVICDGANGQLLAIADSIEITIIRTGAATGIAARYLSHPHAHTATICGCGNQGKISLKALLRARNLEKIFAYDKDASQTERFIREFAEEVTVIPVSVDDLQTATKQSQILVTCTPSREPFIQAEYIQPGTFIAAVGADSEEKQELFPELLAGSKIVTDITEQSAQIGELHHALKAGLMSMDKVHAELGAIICGQKPGRESDEEVIIFDSTGMALQDAAAAAIVYEKAMAKEIGTLFRFS